jgi:tetratricopeptide (TPR) repeat protein
MPDISSVQIPKPLDWQPFQRGCVPLFRKLIDDPTLAEFGRGGQKQRGIDLDGYRSGDLAKPVGVQCRHVKSLTIGKIRKDVADARTITPPLTEVIFATTDAHDASIQQDAMTLTAELVKSGWNCRVTVLGWEALQAEIAACPAALQLFWPVGHAASKRDTEDLLAAIQAQGDRVVEAIAIAKSASLTSPLDPKMPDEALSERRDVHERISVYRDLLSEGKTETAIAHLEKMRATVGDLEPFARYRIETNIGAAHLRAGRADKALVHWRAAAEIRPNDPKARANVALGLYANGDDADALALAKAILTDHPDQAGALVVLVQASSSEVDPVELVPAKARTDPDVTASIIAVLRRRDDKRWYDAARNALAQHPNDVRFKQWTAEGTLEPILADTGLLMGKPLADGVGEKVDAAASSLLSVWEILSEDEAADQEPLAALAQNCAAALRFSQRNAEAAAVIDKALQRVGHNPALIRIRALLHLHADEDELAVRVLGDNPSDPALSLLRAEMLAQTDRHAAAAAIDTVTLAELPTSIARTAMKLRLELALDLNDLPRASSLVDELASLGEPRAGLALARARMEQKKDPGAKLPAEGVEDSDADEPLLHAHALALIESLRDEDVDFLTRVSGAQFLESLGAHDAASNALHGRVDITRDTIALRTYLGASVSAGMMVRARDTLAALPSSIASLPFYKRVNATLLWNTGNTPAAAEIVADLRRLFPRRLDLLLWHLDCLLRLGQEDEVRKIVAALNDEEFEGELRANMRLARAFGAFGQPERALRIAYRLFLLKRDTAEAWMTLMAVVLGLANEGGPDLLRREVDDEAVIEVKTDRGEVLHYSLESDEQLRRYTTDAIDVSHPVAAAARGRKAGDTFTHPDGATATLVSVKNKYLAAFHTAMNRYNDRFPSASGLRRVHVEFDTLGGLDEMKRVLGARSRHVADQARRYADGETFLGGLAISTGADPVEAMLGLSELGLPFRVANGFHEEREAAFEAITRNAAAGCIVDGPTFHIVRRLSLETVVSTICGPIAITQATLDSLRERLQMLGNGQARQAGSLSYVDGQLQMRETTPD